MKKNKPIQKKSVPLQEERTSKVKRKRFWIVLISIVSVFILAMFGLPLLFRGEAMEGEEIEDETEYTYSVFVVRENDPTLFDGKVEAAHIQEIYYDQSLGVIAQTENALTDGQFVEEGQELFSYTNEETRLQLEEQNRLHGRMTQHNQTAETELANAKQIFYTAEANIAETNKKIENHLNSVEDVDETFDRTLEKLQNDLATYESQKAEAEGVIQSTPSTIQEYNEQLEDLVASIEALRSQLTTTVTSNTTGIVQINETGLRNPEVPYVRIVSEEIKIDATVSEYDYEEIELGMMVDIRVVNSERELKGSISLIGEMPADDVVMEGATASRYPFTVVPEEHIHYGYSVQVALASKKLSLPSSVLYDSDESQATVFVHHDGVVEEREIDVRFDGSLILVESGLEVGEELIYQPFDLVDGQEVLVESDLFMDDEEWVEEYD